ncbi:N-acetylneuraminate synthase [Janthinobacterium sp. SUN118]|uniref:N-acetylneuraminate synthase n=1 Tax=Janthinobacterium sp. SUN118 TaxID=3004100 RepID=UPI0025AFEF1E|nr:N-acetylneuraminate synthase [Janthinobacterium sp. SUN118]MDN2708446.1 N-acetylneuraminate synthase [Janthinobacterium sp. SUN118]
MNKVLIIAEAGVNHNADINIAKKLIDVAKEAGADIVKFQTAVPELVMTEQAEKAVYQIDNTGIASESQLDMAKKIHLPLEAYKELLDYSNSVGIKFLSTPFDHVSIDYLYNLGLDIFKIPSGEITNLPYLQTIGRMKTNVILSTGMSTLDEIGEALKVLIAEGTLKENITVLHCNTDYPTKMTDVNLKAMITIGEVFGVKIGYSDHTLGIEVPVAAVAIGATVIEKHFTLDRSMDGPDHLASLEPDELKEMVNSIRNIEKAMGSAEKLPTESETKNIVIARRSIHIVDGLTKGHVITEKDLIMKRPGDGISPMHIQNVLNKKLNKDVTKDHKLSIDDLV